MSLALQNIVRLADPCDNAGVVVRRLEAGTRLATGEGEWCLPNTVLEGHRIALCRVEPGGALLSWGLPFGMALRRIEAGEYLCNATILAALRQRSIDFELPSEPNFENHRIAFDLQEGAFRPGVQVPLHEVRGRFDGYVRAGGRGVGTRNFLVVIGASARTASLARAIAERFRGEAGVPSGFDGVVAVAHTEGSSVGTPNNLELTLRTLAGFFVHPNVGAFVCLDHGSDHVTNRGLEAYCREFGYPLDAVPHRFVSVSDSVAAATVAAVGAVAELLPMVRSATRASAGLEHLKLALQCGGSDAFSGISGNPLAGWLSRELVQHGGTASLAETDELIGAEPYVLANVRDWGTASAFLERVRRFQEMASWHGTSAEGNPSGGNMYRGLYNITVKSIGAARKKDPLVRLDHVIDHAERMGPPGFYFMDSPGNDLEGIAGQVASGCNMVLFTTGNGSITNFPFVPTLKVMTNSPRFRLLEREMDINAGAYLDGRPMDELGREAFEQLVRAASGGRTAGEAAGHAQVQLWRDWRQTDGKAVAALPGERRPDGRPVPCAAAEPADVTAAQECRIDGFIRGGRRCFGDVALVMPTSLCAGQVARVVAEELERQRPSTPALQGFRRYVALPHTEGCGVGGLDNEEIQLRAMAGYLVHPSVARAILVEHGCEKTHNDAMRNHLRGVGVDPGRYGWASIQMDGGLEAVTRRIQAWFRDVQTESTAAQATLADTRWGIVVSGAIPGQLECLGARLVRVLVGVGATVVLPETSPLLAARSGLLPAGSGPVRPSLAHAEIAVQPGLHVMESPNHQLIEECTGVGASGVDLLLVLTSDGLVPVHPFIPTVQVGAVGPGQPGDGELDLYVGASGDADVRAMIDLGVRALSGRYESRGGAAGLADFQVTRGRFGFTL